MFGQSENKPVTVVVAEAFKGENGEHLEIGTVLKDMPADQAMELAGAGRVRLATKEAIAELKALAESKKAQAAAATADPMTAAVAAGVVAALQAMGFTAQPAKAAEPKAA